MTFKVYKSDHSHIAWAAVTNYLDLLEYQGKLSYAACDNFLIVDTSKMATWPELGEFAEQHVYDTIQSYIDR